MSEPVDPVAAADEDAGAASSARIVGVGASAGGLDALTQLFSAVPEDTGLAFVVVQHLSPDHPSMMPELLARHTRLKTRHVVHGERPAPNTVHLLPPKNLVELDGGHLLLVPQTTGHAPSYAVDHFFRSLARDQGASAIGIVLSGSGSDGTQGVRAINEGGGIVVVQSPDTAGFDGMPRSAAATGVADFVLSPDAIPDALLSVVNHSFSFDHQIVSAGYGNTRLLSEIFGLLERRCGIDFGAYKPSTTMRRIERRMVTIGARTLQSYVEALEREPGEIDHLHRDLLIGVTKFFRDSTLFRTIETQAIADIFERPGFDGVVRLWSAGCSTGEEAYSLAMLVKEYCEARGVDADIKVFATDVDRTALERASSGLYPEGIAADVSPERLARFFTREESGFRVMSSLRNLLVFAPQNLLTDPPFTRIDLVSCRNVLIYLEPATQRKLLALFHFALRPGGFLFLGGAESVGDLVGGFTPVDVRSKLYRRNVGRVERDPTDWERSRGRGPATLTRPVSSYDRDRAVMLSRFHAALVDRYAPTSLLVDRLGHILQSSGEPERFLRFPTGVASLDITKVARPGLSPMLTTAVQRSLRERSEVAFEEVEVDTDDGKTKLRVRLRVRPMAFGQGADAAVDYLLVSFEPVEGAIRPVQTTTVTRDEYVMSLESELRHNRDNLSATIEELETANEELQATNEELLAANEELQSTNEELQATNEELHTVNSEHQRKITELEELNADIDNFFRTAHVGTLFLNAKLEIRRFTPAATRVVSLLEQDVGRPLGHLSDRIGGSFLVGACRRVLDRGNGEDLEAEVDGRSLLIQVRPYEGRGTQEQGVVVTFVDVTELVEARRRLQEVIDSLPELVAVLDLDGTIQLVNRPWLEQFERGNVDIGDNYLDVVRRSVASGDESARPVLEGLEALLREEDPQPFAHEYPCHDVDQERWFLIQACPLASGRGAVLSHVDVTRRVLAELRPR